jgi:hypothetical protein
MLKALKYLAIIVACVTSLVILNRLRGCASVQEGHRSRTDAPDSSFAPVTRDSYQPPSLPFSERRLGVKLPRGVSETDVKRIVSVEVTNIPPLQVKKIDIVETMSGQVIVERDSSVKSVNVTTVEPRLVSLEFRSGAGLSLSRDGSRTVLSPAGVLAPVRWSGSIDAPTLVADLDGIGPGAQLQVYHDIHLGAARLWRFDGGYQAKLTLIYML